MSDEAVRDALEAVEPPFDESAENALRYFGLEAHDVERIRDQLALIFVYVDDDSTYSWETRDALHTGLIYAYEAAIRASERAKWDAVKQGYVDAAATIEAEFRHYRERFEPIMEEAVASERAKVEALVEAAERMAREVSYGREGVVGLRSVRVAHVDVTTLESFYAARDAVRAGRAS